MNTQIIKVYYDQNALPYKDKERTVHFPITGSTFLGSSDTTKIRFYVDGYLADESALWISVSKRADGTQGSQFLTSGTDENGDKYREMTLSGWYTEKKGDLYISLKGYQGGSTGYWDEETGMYIVQGVPVIRATGSIKLAINYAPVGEYPYYQDEMASFQDLVAQLGNKLNITSGIVVVSDITNASAVLYTEGQLLYSKADKKLYQLVNGSFTTFFETYDKATIENKLDEKVDKLSTSGKYAYTHEGSTQGETQVSEDVVNGAIPQRTNNGQLKVPATPTDNSHATSKSYVDNSISSERTFLLGVINDAGHSLGLVESTDPSKEYDYIIQLKDKAGNVISSVELDLPLEQIITAGSYDSATKEIVLTLDNGSEVRIPVGDLVEGLVDEQGLETALAPYIKEINVSSVLSTNDLLEQVGVEKYFILDNMGSLCLCYIIEDSGTYTLSVISKEIAYHNTFTENTLVRNLLGDGTLDIDYLPVITLSQAMQTLTLGEMEIANQDNSIIKYNGRIYHKANETESAIEYVSADYDIADSSTNTVITKYEISVNKSTKGTNAITIINYYYDKSQTDTLLGAKQNTLVSGQNIKTINNQSLLGSGNIDVGGGSGSAEWGDIGGDIDDQTDLQNELQDIREVAEGKCRTFVISYLVSVSNLPNENNVTLFKKTNGENFTSWQEFLEYVNENICYNSDFNSQNNYVQPKFYDNQGGFILTNDRTIIVEADLPYQTNDSKLGDIFLVEQIDVPDRWYGGGYNFYKLETSKIDLDNYATKSELTSGLATKQNTLVSGQNIKTINGQSILGSGDLPVSGGGADYTAGYGIDIADDTISVDTDEIATRDFVNSSIATNTATFRGTYNVVSDLSLTTSATHQEIASAIATKLASLSIVPDDNDYVFVSFPNATVSTDFDKYERYKFNGTSWEYEYTLNNRSFTGDFGFPIITAPSSTTLTADEVATISNGAVFLGSSSNKFLNYEKIVFFPLGEASFGENGGFALCVNGFVPELRSYRINSQNVISINDVTTKRTRIASVAEINGKSIPDYPSSTGTFVLKCVNGTLTWVEE